MALVAVEELLLEEDLEFLRQKAFSFDADRVNAFVHVIIRGYQLPAGLYTPAATDLLIRLPANYPLLHPDMFWMFPAVRLGNGNYPDRADQFETFGDRQWQRWSRHMDAKNWRPSVDRLQAYLATIRRDLSKGL